MPMTVAGIEDWPEAADPLGLRPLPYEDVYFYCKKIDNGRLVREADPAARRKSVGALSVGVATALLVMLFLLPDALGMFAGYQVHSLERANRELAREKSTLELEEARLLSPERLTELARQLQLVDPVPGQVMYINPKAEGALALNVSTK